MQATYWDWVMLARPSRRRVLAGIASISSAAIFAACGKSGGSQHSSSQPASSGLVTKPTDTTRQAKRGGTMKDRTHSDTPTLDVLTSNAPHNSIGPHVYSSLLQFKPGYLKRSENEVVGDLAESWEWAPDGLAIVMRLRPNVRWHNKPPVSGRALSVDDVLFSWDRFSTKSAARTAIANAADANAPIVSVTAPDAKTVVAKLKEPLVYAPWLLAANSAGNVVIVPRESDSTLDLRGDMIGTGPFVLTKYAQSAGFTLSRNPDYYDPGYALVDQVDMPIVAEYAAALSQFKAGNIYTMGSSSNTPLVSQEDILQVHRDEPRISIYEGDLARGAILMSLGWLPAGKSPFIDERVRQAISMAVDRDLYLDTFHNVSKFAAQGLAVETRWNTSIEGTAEGWWLDPKGKDFGPNAKYFKYDLAEGKKLLAAAGYPNGLKGIVSSYPTGSDLPNIPPRAAVLDGMFRELGIESTVNSLDYAKQYIPQYRDGRGQYEGWAYKGGGGGVASGDPVSSLSGYWWSKGGATFFGFSASGQNDLAGDPQADRMIERARVETDNEKRRALVFDIQRYLAKPCYSFFTPGVASGFVMAWPAVGNFNVYQGARLNYERWVDDSKPPFRSS